MKKRIAIIAAACLLLFATACGKKLPNGMSQKTYDAATEALKAEEAYLKGEISADEVYAKIDSIYDLLSTFTFDDVNEQTQNDLVTFGLSVFNLGILAGSDVTGSYDTLKDLLD